MKNKSNSKVLVLFLTLILMVVVSGCSGKAASAADLPTYPGATELKPGEDPIADTLLKNAQQDAALRDSIGVGGGIEQKAYRLPADGTWEAVKSFYADKLKAEGWKSGAGGIAGDLTSQVLETANQANDLFKTSMWSKGKQVLTIIRMVDTPDATQAYLIISLNTN